MTQADAVTDENALSHDSDARLSRLSSLALSALSIVEM
jgi:hypothetical protein